MSRSTPIAIQFMNRLQSLALRLEAESDELKRFQKDINRQLQIMDRQLRKLAEGQEWFETVFAQRKIEPLHLTAKFVATFRVCTTCGQLKSLDNFYLRPVAGKPDRRHRQCRDCQTKKAARSYHAQVSGERRKQPRAGLEDDSLNHENFEEQQLKNTRDVPPPGGSD